MTAFGDRLNALSLAARFGIKDMSIWFECDKSAMREWMKHDVMPLEIKQAYLNTRLDMLEQAIKKFKTMLPVPMHVKQYARAQYVEQVRDHALRKLSKTGSSTAGA